MILKRSSVSRLPLEVYEQCDEALKREFERVHQKPMLYRNGIYQCNLQNEIVREFECKYDCIKSLLMSDKTLTKALANGVQYNEHIFKEAGSRLHIGGRGTEVPPNPLLCLEES